MHKVRNEKDKPEKIGGDKEHGEPKIDAEWRITVR